MISALQQPQISGNAPVSHLIWALIGCDEAGAILYGLPVSGKRMGWPTGFEPATARSTIWGSNRAELWPPPANKLDFQLARVKFTHGFEKCEISKIFTCKTCE